MGRSCNSSSALSFLNKQAMISNYSKIATSPNSWIDDYFSWLDPTFECCRIYFNGTFCPSTGTVPSLVTIFVTFRALTQYNVRFRVFFAKTNLPISISKPPTDRTSVCYKCLTEEDGPRPPQKKFFKHLPAFLSDNPNGTLLFEILVPFHFHVLLKFVYKF